MMWVARTCHLSPTGHGTEHGQGLVIYLQIWRLHGSESTHKTLQALESRAAGGKGQTGETSAQPIISTVRALLAPIICFYMNWFIVFVIFRLTVNNLPARVGEKEQTFDLCLITCKT